MSIDARNGERWRRLRWQCRRGVLELDLLLERFLEQRYPALTMAECEAFGRLLSSSDQVLWAWIQGTELPPPELRDIIRKVSQ